MGCFWVVLECPSAWQNRQQCHYGTGSQASLFSIETSQSINCVKSLHVYIVFPCHAVIGKPLVFKVDGCGHQRSESSTDSFVCVSEDTGLEAESVRSQPHDEPDTDSWEHLGSELGGSGSRNSRAKLSEMGEEDAANGVLSQKENQSILQSIELIVSADAARKEKKEGAEERDSNSSEWEDWDD